MATVLEDIDRSFRLLFVFKSIGDGDVGLASAIEKFVWGERETEQVEKKDGGEEKAVSSCFVAETQNILHFYSSVLNSYRELFREFLDFSLKCGKPIATVLSSSRVNCGKCGKKLAFENKVIPVVIYSNRRGTYLGSRLTKVCRKCKIYEHHGYWSVEGKRRFNSDSASSEFLLSSEDAAFEIDVLTDKSDSRFAVVRFVNHKYDYRLN